jgi:hypothetical protein
MKIISLFLLFAALAGIQNVKAQTAETDSAHTAGIASHDAFSFRLKHSDYKKFTSEHFPASSDYFKPTDRYASNAALLNDSAYVKTFRLAAYNKALHQKAHTAGHTLLIGGGITAAVVILLAFIAGPHEKY